MTQDTNAQQAAAQRINDQIAQQIGQLTIDNAALRVELDSARAQLTAMRGELAAWHSRYSEPANTELGSTVG
jgi:hypothetical protein